MDDHASGSVVVPGDDGSARAVRDDRSAMPHASGSEDVHAVLGPLDLAGARDPLSVDTGIGTVAVVGPGRRWPHPRRLGRHHCRPDGVLWSDPRFRAQSM